MLFIVWLLLKRRFFSGKHKVLKNSFQEMESVLEKRYTAVTDFVKSLENKGFSTDETKTITIDLMYAAAAGDLNIVASANVQISNKLKAIFTDISDNENLKNDRELCSQMEKIGKIECDLAKMRKNYNSIVREYNCECKIFPSVIVAKIFRYKQYPFFAADVSVQDMI